MTMKYVMTFSVAPALGMVVPEFPLDMLRYDACFPDGQEDAGLIAASLGDSNQLWLETSYGGNLEIRLRSYRPDARSAPTRARWARYGWEVSDVKREQLRLQCEFLRAGSSGEVAGAEAAR